MIDYLALIFLVIVYIILVLLNSFSPQLIKLLTAGFAVLYFFWGLWHHHKEKSLHPKITLEYLIIVLLGLWLIVGIY